MTTTGKWTTTAIRAAKGKQKLSCLTAYDALIARQIDEAGLPLILVGDSLAMTVLGYDTTLPITLDEMLHHTSAVVRAVKHALVIADMPFMSYQGLQEQAVANAGRFLKEAGADAVKIEGGAFRAPLVKTFVQNGIPVVGHIGLTPQSVRELGGYKVQGTQPAEAAQLIEDAKALTGAGAFAIVLECVPAALGADITAAIDVPTIGIGAGAGCDGQVLVTPDLLGLTPGTPPKFVKQYADLGAAINTALSAYRTDVENGSFPAPEQTY